MTDTQLSPRELTGLRDQIAVQAFSIMLEAALRSPMTAEAIVSTVPDSAYGLADKMLAARAK